MVPDDDLRKNILNELFDISPYTYEYYNRQFKDMNPHDVLDKLYNIYLHAGKPSIKSTKNYGNILVPLYEKIRGSGSVDRANYNSVTNTMYIETGDDLLEELSHAVQYRAKGFPKGGLFNLGFGLPGDVEVRGKDGYERFHNPEFVAHSIIQPILEDYLTKQNMSFDEVRQTSNDVYNNPKTYGIPTTDGKGSYRTVRRHELVPLLTR